MRIILTIAGELRLTRNYHHCGRCNHGFYPRDAELKLPEGGEVSDATERRILDFRNNDTFDSVTERWGIHYPACAVRRLSAVYRTTAPLRFHRAIRDALTAALRADAPASATSRRPGRQCLA